MSVPVDGLLRRTAVSARLGQLSDLPARPHPCAHPTDRQPPNRPVVQAKRARAPQTPAPAPTNPPANPPGPPLSPGRPLASPPCRSGLGQGSAAGRSPQATRPQGAPLRQSVEARHCKEAGGPTASPCKSWPFSTPHCGTRTDLGPQEREAERPPSSPLPRRGALRQTDFRRKAWMAEATAIPRGIGTAFPICFAISVFEPHQRNSLGNPWIRAAS